jgi:hypothetical protein
MDAKVLIIFHLNAKDRRNFVIDQKIVDLCGDFVATTPVAVTDTTVSQQKTPVAVNNQTVLPFSRRCPKRFLET